MHADTVNLYDPHSSSGASGSRTHDKDGEEQFSLEVGELGHLGDVIQCVKRVQPALRVQVAIATDQLRRTPVAQT